MHYMRDPIEVHRLGYGPITVPAINVKHYGRWPFNAGEQDKLAEIARLTGDPEDRIAEWIWESTQEQFWEDAQELAREAGYKRCYSEGRSGGWLYVEPHISVDRDRDGEYTIADFGERSRWLAFQRRINSMLESVDANLSHGLTFHLELAQEDQAALIAEAI